MYKVNEILDNTFILLLYERYWSSWVESEYSGFNKRRSTVSAVGKMTNKKTEGPDRILAEVWKALWSLGKGLLTKFFNKIPVVTAYIMM